MVCDEQGLLGHELLAMDGCKMSSNAAKEWSGKLSELIATLEHAANRIEGFLADATPRMGQGNKAKEVQSNITDNESVKMKTSKGTLQGYNGIATLDRKHQVIVDASAFGAGPEQFTLPVSRTWRICITQTSTHTYPISISDSGMKDLMIRSKSILIACGRSGR